MVRISGQGHADTDTGALRLFSNELDRLVQELWTWSPTRWTPARVALARGLALDLVAAADLAGTVHPAVELPEVASWGLADQLAVLGHDVTAAPHAERAAAQALAHLAAARAALLSGN